MISTGTELVEPGDALERDEQIFDSNSYLLAAAVRGAGAQVFRVGQVGDDGELLKRVVLEQLLRADLILTSGGISQGDYDVVKAVMPEIGVCDFASVAMQPGKPQGFGLIGADQVPMIMLPGNPVSSFVSFEVFVRPVIRKLMGAQPYVRADGQGGGGARDDVGLGPAAAGPRRGQLHRVRAAAGRAARRSRLAPDG